MKAILVLFGSALWFGSTAWAEDRLWTKAEIVADAANPDSEAGGPRTWELKLAHTEPSENSVTGVRWFVTKHADMRVAVYSIQPGGYRLERTILGSRLESTSLGDPQWFTVMSEKYGRKDSRSVKLFVVTTDWSGTGCFVRYHVFAEHGQRLVPVKWISPVDTLPWRFLEGQYVAKGIGMRAVKRSEQPGSGLQFLFGIWNKDDGNCCPSGGLITGEFGLFERDPPTNAGLPADPILQLRAKSYHWEPDERTGLPDFDAKEKTDELPATGQAKP